MNPDRVFFEVRGVRIMCSAHIEDEIRRICESHKWVYKYLQTLPGTGFMRGRQPVLSGVIAGEQCVVKRLFHGGFSAGLTRDRFLTPNRVLNAMKAADYLNQKAILTPEYLFASWSREGFWIRCESGVKLLCGGIEAAAFFFGSEGKAEPDGIAQWSQALGSVVNALHRVNFLHRDLNLMNFLFMSDGQIAVLDLDKSSPPEVELGVALRRKNLARLIRSIRKVGHQHPQFMVESIVRGVLHGYGAL